MQSFVKIKSSWNGEITLLFTNIGKSCPSCKFLSTQICLKSLFMKYFTKFNEFTVLCPFGQNAKRVILSRHRENIIIILSETTRPRALRFVYACSQDVQACLERRNMSCNIRFPTMCYLRPAKAQTSLGVCTVWSELLQIAWIIYDWTAFGISKLKSRPHRLVCVYTCQNVTLLEITCQGSYVQACLSLSCLPMG